MPTKSTTVRARLEPKLKQETELIFEELGINTTEAIRFESSDELFEDLDI